MEWQGFNVYVFEILEDVSGALGVNFNVQIPLKGRAIQMTLSGPAARKQALRQQLQDMLAGLEGKSNWHKEDDVAAAPGAYRGWLLVLTYGAAQSDCSRFGLCHASRRAAPCCSLL